MIIRASVISPVIKGVKMSARETNNISSRMMLTEIQDKSIETELCITFNPTHSTTINMYSEAKNSGRENYYIYRCTTIMSPSELHI